MWCFELNAVQPPSHVSFFALTLQFFCVFFATLVVIIVDCILFYSIRLIVHPCLCVLCLIMCLPCCHPYPSTRAITIMFFSSEFSAYVQVCAFAAWTDEKADWEGKKKERRRLHSLFQNRRQRGKEKQAKGEVRRVPVRKDEKRGGEGGEGGGGWGI